LATGLIAGKLCVGPKIITGRGTYVHHLAKTAERSVLSGDVDCCYQFCSNLFLRQVRREWALLSFHSVCLSVCWSFSDLQPTTIDLSQPNLVSRYIPVLGPVSAFFGSLSPYFWCQREKYAKFRLFPTRILDTANVTHRAIWLVFSYSESEWSVVSVRWSDRCNWLSAGLHVVRTVDVYICIWSYTECLVVSRIYPGGRVQDRRLTERRRAGEHW